MVKFDKRSIGSENNCEVAADSPLICNFMRKNKLEILIWFVSIGTETIVPGLFVLLSVGGPIKHALLTNCRFMKDSNRVEPLVIKTSTEIHEQTNTCTRMQASRLFLP